jgi:hypothetical protein
MSFEGLGLAVGFALLLAELAGYILHRVMD